MEIETEQLKSREELLDEMLTTADQPEVTPAEEQPAEAPVENAPQEPAVEPVLDAATLLKEKEELAQKVEALSKERDGLIGKVKQMRGKTREQRDAVMQKLETVQRRLDEVESHQSKREDPLKVWRANPENEGTPPPDDILQAHDTYVLTQAESQRAKPQDVKTAAAQVDAAMLRSTPNEQMLVQAAVDRRFFTEADILAMAGSPNPAQTAVTIARERFDTYGTEQELDLLNRLFTSEQAHPAQPVESPVSAAPKTQATTPKPTPKPAPKPKEQSDEADFEPEGLAPHHREIASMFFPKR